MSRYKQMVSNPENAKKNFIEFNGAAFVLGPIWMLHKGFVLEALIYFSIIALEVVYSSSSAVPGLETTITVFALHVLLGFFGNTLACRKYWKAKARETVDLSSRSDLNSKKLTVFKSGKPVHIKKFEVSDVVRILQGLEEGFDHGVVLERQDGFAQTYVSETRNGEKFYHLEYRGSSEHDHFESKDLQPFEMTRPFFEKFFNGIPNFDKGIDWELF